MKSVPEFLARVFVLVVALWATAAFNLPLSSFLSAETRAVLTRQNQEFDTYGKVCPYRPPESVEDVVAQRRCGEEHYYPAVIGRHRARYNVTIEPETIAGVPTEIITPAEGAMTRNAEQSITDHC